jgi:hypothetical protein
VSRRAIRGVVLVLGAMSTAAVAGILCAIWWWDPCDARVITRCPSPDKRYDALVFVTGCGATTPDTYHVSVVNFHLGHASREGRRPPDCGERVPRAVP